jgi:hypothetical protein
MKGERSARWRVGLGIVGGVAVLLAACGFAGWRALTAFFQRRYYVEGYAPLELSADDVGTPPTRHHLDDVPWIATRESYCQANSLAMVAAQHGVDASAGLCSFLMGFTYGAVEVPGVVGINPFTDPEHGFIVAAPYLGLERRYYVTDDAALYLKALRYTLSQGYAVRVALDAGVLYGLDEPLPHSDLLVGYDESGFIYYETVCLPEFPCEPRRLPPGEEGLWVAEGVLLDAVSSQAELFSYPWRYALTLFEEGPLVEDLGPIWARNGQLLIGGVPYGPRQGADAIDKLAATVEKQGSKLDASQASWGLEAAVYARHDNAAYLRSLSTAQADLTRAAELLDRAAEAYAQALATLEDGVADRTEADQVAAWLRDAAAAEREAGEIFLTQGQ